MFGRKETPQEYEQRKARQAAEKAQRQRDYEARKARREQKKREWEQKEREFARNRSAKQNLVSQMRSLANQLNADNVKQSCAKRKSLWSSFKNAGYAGKEYNKPLGSEMKSASDAFQRQLESIFQKREVKYRQAKAAKELLVSEAQSFSQSTDWKNGGAKARDMQARWKKAGYAGRDHDQALWNSFHRAIQAFFDRRDKHFAKVSQEYEKNASVKRGLIAEQSRLTSSVGPSSDFKSIKSRMADLMAQWKRSGSAGKQNSSLWSEFNSSRQSCFDYIKEEERKAREKREEKRRDFEFNAFRKRSLISDHAVLNQSIQSSSDLSVKRAEVDSLFSRWKAIGRAGHEDSMLWDEFNGLRKSAFDSITAARKAQSKKSNEGRNRYSRGQEVAKDDWGNYGRHSKGDEGSVSQTQHPKSGKGKTTIHPDGRHHHHGSHSKEGKHSFTDPEKKE